ncbi:MAG: ATP-binding protein [Myxococcaceae bacterium]|nr:ATP-binding protein [Myxococcaceae bacterium]
MDFRERAWFEAERYGADPWVFVRELLQNARDAGAARVRIDVSERDGSVRLVCRDDGAGMTEAHARRFLFRLYASSKEGEQGMAGRFGVGFWSILRFEPKVIVVRSWPREGTGWEITLDGKLEHAQSVVLPHGYHGTELVLTRPARPDDDVSRQVKDAARMHGRYLLAKGSQEPLDVVIDGERITEELSLPAPSATFRRRGVRGAVALGDAPHVELFSKGLHVRTAASVDELLASPDATKSRPMAPLLEGLAPQVVLDGDALNLVRSRSDARDDKALRRAVQLSQRELARLIERQLQFSRPVPWWRRALKPALVGAAVLLSVVGGAWLASGFLRTERPRPPIGARPLPPTAAEPYRDPASHYAGPRTDALPSTQRPVDLTYWPAAYDLHFASFHLTRPSDGADLTWLPYGSPLLRRPYVGDPCTENCVNVRLSLSGPGWARLPVPTGYQLDRSSLHGAGDVRRTPEGEPAIYLPSSLPIEVVYRVGLGAAPVDRMPHEVINLRGSAPDVSMYRTDAAKAEALRRWVAQHIEYSNDPSLKVLRELQAAGFVESALLAGAGDCDVQNAVLALMLQSSGVAARLTVGYIGRDGQADPLLHAWVEYWDRQNDAWRVSDASLPLSPAIGAKTPARPTRAAAAAPSKAPVAVAGRLPDLSKLPSAPAVPAGFQVTVPEWHAPAGAFALLGVGPLFALLFLVFRPRVKRETQLDAEHDVSRLLQGALARPEAFQHVPALFEQPLVPRRGAGAISLGQAYELAAAGRLYSSDAGLAFSERAMKAGAVVIDAMRPEGKVVAEALGAVNLDRWDTILRGVGVTPLLEEVNRHLAARGERWKLMLSAAVSHEPEILNVPGSKDQKWVVLNGDAQWLEKAEASSAGRPKRALFQVIDEAALWLRMPAARRGRLLAPLARAAMLEELEARRPSSPGPQQAQQRIDEVDAAAVVPAPGKVRS